MIVDQKRQIPVERIPWNDQALLPSKYPDEVRQLRDSWNVEKLDLLRIVAEKSKEILNERQKDSILLDDAAQREIVQRWLECACILVYERLYDHLTLQVVVDNEDYGHDCAALIELVAKHHKHMDLSQPMYGTVIRAALIQNILITGILDTHGIPQQYDHFITGLTFMEACYRESPDVKAPLERLQNNPDADPWIQRCVAAFLKE